MGNDNWTRVSDNLINNVFPKMENLCMNLSRLSYMNDFYSYGNGAGLWGFPGARSYLGGSSYYGGLNSGLYGGQNDKDYCTQLGQALDRIYQSRLGLSDSTDSNTPTEEADSNIGENFYNDGTGVIADSSDYKQLLQKSKDGETLTDTEQSNLKSLYSKGLSKLAASFINYVDKEKGDKDGKLSQSEFVEYYKAQMSDSGKTDTELEADAKKVYEYLNVNADGEDSLDTKEVANMLALMDAGSDGNSTSGSIEKTDVTATFNSILTNKGQNVASNYNNLFKRETT